MPKMDRDKSAVIAAKRMIRVVVNEELISLSREETLRANQLPRIERDLRTLADMCKVARLLSTGAFQKAHDLAQRVESRGLAVTGRDLELPKAFWSLFEE